ncbi:MAG: ribbon-helix-helix domain-containing protein [Dehalococcoidales bacterium]|nr:ribbon-helix-helix domain-containing protein [Dehalococcoidales bacterium]
MANTAKLTISLPRELILLADQLAKENKISRSKVVSACLRDVLEKHKAAEMAEGYKAMAKEQQQLAVTAAKFEHEVLPEWQ